MGREAEILTLFPTEMRKTYERVALKMEWMEEIRLRAGRPILVSGRGKEYYLAEDGTVLYESGNAFCPDRKYLDKVLNHICGYSTYAFEDEIKKGFLTVPGGHRIGLAGEIILQKNQIFSMKNLNAMNIRISHEIKGVADKVMPYIADTCGIRNTLIISPPGCGKTTLLRDIIRQISEGCGKEKKGYTVGVVDERSEIGGCFCGELQNDLGPRTDLLDGCPKEVGMMMLLRSMNPQVIAVDEIGTAEDAYAIGQALRSGCHIIATIHGNDVMQICERKMIGKIMKEHIFERYILLGNRRHPGDVMQILDCDYRDIRVNQTVVEDEIGRNVHVGLR